MRLAVEDLNGERGGEVIFAGVSFALTAGQALLVTGPNGAGKSTLLRILAGLLPTSEGSIAFESVDGDWPDVMAASHYLGHRNAMKTAMTVDENLAFWRDFLGPGRRTIEDALALLGLAAIGHLPFGYLSTGQRRRAAIARLLVSDRPIWLLDEPTSGFDAAAAAAFSDIVQDHLDTGGLAIAATHLPLGLSGARELRMGDA